LVAGGRETAAAYRWEERIEALERFYAQTATTTLHPHVDRHPAADRG
jgi:hypothetical protein